MKHRPDVQRVTQAAYRVEDTLSSLDAAERRGSPNCLACRPTHHDPHRLPLPEVVRRRAELEIALDRAATVLEETLAHLDDTPADAELALAGRQG